MYITQKDIKNNDLCSGKDFGTTLLHRPFHLHCKSPSDSISNENLALNHPSWNDCSYIIIIVTYIITMLGPQETKLPSKGLYTEIN